MKKQKDLEKSIENNLVYFSSGSTLIDLVVGGGIGMGFRGGATHNIVGDESSGKSLLACETIANAYWKYKNKFRWKYDDCESGLTFDSKSLYGFDIMKEGLKSDKIEDCFCNIQNFISSVKKDEYGIYVVDSLDGLSSKEIEKGSEDMMKKFEKDGTTEEKGSYQMGSAKFLSQKFFRVLTPQLSDKNILLLIISQTRDKIGSLFPQKTIAGGKALRFYSYTQLWLSVLKKIERKGRMVGGCIKAKTKKSKTPRPFRECIFSYYTDYGIDDIGSNLDFLFDLRGKDGGLLKASQSINWEGKEVTKKDLKDFLEENKLVELYKEEVSSRIKVDDFMEFVKEKSEELFSIFQQKFGIIMSRNVLIDYIENNKRVEELKKRTIDRWERIEDEIKTLRPRKYN